MAFAMFGQPALRQRRAGTVGSDPVDAAHGSSILRWPRPDSGDPPCRGQTQLTPRMPPSPFCRPP